MRTRCGAVAALSRSWACLVIAVAAAATAPDSRAGHVEQSVQTLDADGCSQLLKRAGSSSMSAQKHRRCIQMIANSYLEWSVRKIPADQVPLADDVASYELGQSPSFKAGNRKLLLSNPDYDLLEAISVRSWNVDGDTAWAIYDGSLKSNPGVTAFWVIERFTIKDGLIREILAACKSSRGASCSSSS